MELAIIITYNIIILIDKNNYIVELIITGITTTSS